MVAQVGVGAALLRVDEVGEPPGVADEEDRSVVPHQVVVAVLGVELDGEAAGVALRVRRAELAGNAGEAEEDRGALADRAQEGGLGPPGDVVGDLEEAVGGAAPGVHHPLRHELGHLLDRVAPWALRRGSTSGKYMAGPERPRPEPSQGAGANIRLHNRGADTGCRTRCRNIAGTAAALLYTSGG